MSLSSTHTTARAVHSSGPPTTTQKAPHGNVPKPYSSRLRKAADHINMTRSASSSSTHSARGLVGQAQKGSGAVQEVHHRC